MTPSRCPVCGGDAWDSHAGCMQEEPPRCTGTAPKIDVHDYDTTPRHQMQEQERRIARAWERFDRD